MLCCFLLHQPGWVGVGWVRRGCQYVCGYFPSCNAGRQALASLPLYLYPCHWDQPVCVSVLVVLTATVYRRVAGVWETGGGSGGRVVLPMVWCGKAARLHDSAFCLAMRLLNHSCHPFVFCFCSVHWALPHGICCSFRQDCLGV